MKNELMTASKTGASKISLALIATYPEMHKILEELTAEEGITLHNVFASFEDAAIAAKRIEPKIDAILSRGGTAEYVRRAVNVPVISIPISPFDLCRSLFRLPPEVKEIAFFNFRRNIFGVREIEDMFGVTINEYTFMEREDIETGVKDVINRGIRVIIGGEVAARLARESGIEGIEIISDKEAIHHSLHEVLQIIEVRREEQARAARLKIAFDSLSEGIVVADERKRISICNPAAEYLFHLKENAAIGKNVDNLLPCKELDKAYAQSRKPENIHYLQEIYGNIISTNHMQIYLKDKFLGVVSTFQDITRIQKLENQIRQKLNAKGFLAKYTFDDILTKNERMMRLKELGKLYAETDSAILIEGESGTGKELFAQSLHNVSERSCGPFVAVNCAAIPEQLLESELFGYDSGAFTGAKKEGKPGLFELAHNGTIFLDEIAEIPKSLQSRLLRVLQEKEIMRVGGGKIVPVNIRIISATNHNVLQKVEQGDFREDLYYRLNVFNIKLPPLRERKEDIELLSKAFLRERFIEMDETVGGQLKELLATIKAYDWPGNIRELYNVVERISLIIKNPKSAHCWAEILKEIQADTSKAAPPGANNISVSLNVDGGLKAAVSRAEKEIISAMLELYGNDQEIVLEKLGIGRTTMWRKIREAE